MPIHDADAPDVLLPSQVTERRAGLVPAGTERVVEKPKPVVSEDSPAVLRAIKRVETLKAGGASHVAIEAAQRRVEDARLAVLEKQAEARLSLRATNEQARRDKERAAIERQTLHRMSGFAQVAIKIGSIAVTLHYDRSMDSRVRQLVMGDIHRVLAIAVRESERTAGLAAAGVPVVEHPKFLVAELKDIARRSAQAGCLEIKVI
jgi:hypothetical protein